MLGLQLLLLLLLLLIIMVRLVVPLLATLPDGEVMLHPAVSATATATVCCIIVPRRRLRRRRGIVRARLLRGRACWGGLVPSATAVPAVPLRRPHRGTAAATSDIIRNVFLAPSPHRRLLAGRRGVVAGAIVPSTTASAHPARRASAGPTTAGIAASSAAIWRGANPVVGRAADEASVVAL